MFLPPPGNTDASILVYKFRPERTGFNMYAENTRQQLTFLALVPWTCHSIIREAKLKLILQLLKGTPNQRVYASL